MTEAKYPRLLIASTAFACFILCPRTAMEKNPDSLIHADVRAILKPFRNLIRGA